MIVEIEFVEYEPGGGFFGKRVARTAVRGMTAAERETEIAEMKEILGAHVVAIEVEEIGGTP